MQWETVIGLEIHAQLSTRSKMFSGAATQFAIVDGDDQFGTQNAVTFAPLRVRARDQFNNPVAGVTVTWTVDAVAPPAPTIDEHPSAKSSAPRTRSMTAGGTVPT